MDVQMPEMDGLEATMRIRKEAEPGRHMPIIAMTAHALKGDQVRCIEAGMDDYVSKPLNLKNLLEVLDHWTAIPATGPGLEIIPKDGEDPNSPSQLKGFDFGDTPLTDEDGLFGETSESVKIESLPKRVQPVMDTGPEEPLNLQAALPRFDNDMQFFLVMCKDFMVNMPARMEELRSALQKKDPVSFSRAAHNLKGMSANFDATAVNRIAAQLEKMGGKNNFSGAKSLLDQMEIEIGSLKEYMRGLGVDLSV
jgi:two-component system sensor histidine kinase/response regulator